MSFGDVKYCAFITVSGVKPLSIQEQTDYTYAAASRDETLPVMWISLEYDANDKLVTASGRECRFSDLKGIDIERIKRLGELKAQDWVRIHLLKNKKIGRNDICPCGSGKKYKKCCGK